MLRKKGIDGYTFNHRSLNEKRKKPGHEFENKDFIQLKNTDQTMPVTFENILGKGENTGIQYFLLFPQFCLSFFFYLNNSYKSFANYEKSDKMKILPSGLREKKKVRESAVKNSTSPRLQSTYEPCSVVCEMYHPLLKVRSLCRLI